MDNIPKLLPTWHDITLQEFVRQKCVSARFSSLRPSDHGGIGVDLNINDKIQCKTAKYSKCQIRFTAEKCSVPFLSPRKSKYSNVFFCFFDESYVFSFTVN